MARCYGCNCNFPVNAPTATADPSHPCAGNSVGANSTFAGLPCAYVIIFGCEIPWWKHETYSHDHSLPRKMLVPNGVYYDGPFGESEPSQTYVATFLGKACGQSTGKYVQKEGLAGYPSSHPQCANLGSPLNRICDIQSTTSTTGRNPWTPDANGKMQHTSMTFDIRENDELRALFGGLDDDNPCCCWTVPERIDGSCDVEWDHWQLELTDPGPFSLSVPRLHCMEDATAFWEAVGKPAPQYALDSTFNASGFDPFGENQFALTNGDDHPQLPKTVCVRPLNWPWFQTPCSSDSEGCKSCAPAVETYCGAGLLISGASVTACTGSPATSDISGSVASQCFTPTAGISPDEHNGTLPTGVTNPGASCGYWWKLLYECDLDTPSHVLGGLVYWNGSTWKMTLYCSSDGGVTFSSIGDATLSNVECGCAGISFDWAKSGVECVCCGGCSGCNCGTLPASVTATWSSTYPDSGSASLALTGCGYAGTMTTALGESLEITVELDTCRVCISCNGGLTACDNSPAVTSCDPIDITATFPGIIASCPYGITDTGTLTIVE